MFNNIKRVSFEDDDNQYLENNKNDDEINNKIYEHFTNNIGIENNISIDIIKSNNNNIDLDSTNKNKKKN